tara:strand:- start:7269 stop:8486 length:1218 start_codon:yes stop_codon:yes gene_type:complete
MAEVLGFCSIALVSLIILIFALRLPSIANILFVALVVRVSLMLIGYYGFTLPDSTFDAMGFEQGAWDRSQEGFYEIITYGVNSNYIKSIIALPYALFGRSLLMAQSISLLFGMGTVLLGWLLTKKLWGEDNAIKVGWILALFPTLILYSVLTLREVYSCFFILVAMIGVVDWVRSDSYRSISLALLGFGGGIFFHGAVIIGGLIFLVLVFSRSSKKVFYLLLNYRTNPKHLLIILLSLIFLAFYFSNKIHIPKLGTFEDSINLSRLTNELGFRLKGEASYPEWTRIETPAEFIYKGLARIFYLLFSPFPWDVKKPNHLIGMLDGFLYMSLVYLVLRNLKAILKDPALRAIFIILFCYLFIFGIGVSNFGAGTRHRSKFVVELIILAAPLIPKITFLSKKRFRELF